MGKRLFGGILSLVIITVFVSSVLAGESKRHMDEDPEFVEACSDDEGFAYVRRDSVVLGEYEPPMYTAKGTVVYLDRKKRYLRTVEESFSYDYGARKMYITTDGDETYISPVDKDPEASRIRAVGEVIFTLANNREFYGKNGGFKNEFYENIRLPGRKKSG